MHNNTIDIKSLPEQIFYSIKKMILSGTLKGGARISEEKIAGDFGVSRTPIREALRRLEEYGLITIEPRRYAEVLKMSHDEVEQLTVVRIALEKLALSLFLSGAAEKGLDSLRETANACRLEGEKGDIGAFYEKDSLFHLEIARRSGNPFLYQAMEKLDAKVQLSRLVKPMDLAGVKAAMAEHEEILAAAAARDAGNALEKMETHITNNL